MAEYGKPRRILTRSGGGLRGYCSLKDSQANWESSIEKRFVQVARLSRRVSRIVSQPWKLKLLVDGMRSTRTPDFGVDTDMGHVIVECKPYAKLLDPETRAHLRPVRDHVRSEGGTYVVVTERDLELDATYENAIELAAFRLPHGADPQVRVRADATRDAISHLLPAPLSELEAATSQPEYVMVLLANFGLFFDFRNALSKSTTIYREPLAPRHDPAHFLFRGETPLE